MDYFLAPAEIGLTFSHGLLNMKSFVVQRAYEVASLGLRIDEQIVFKEIAKVS